MTLSEVTCLKLTFAAIVGVLLGGCASHPEPQADRTVPLDASNMVAAQKAGYKMVNENGQTLYCKRRAKTGTHARQETQCLTEQEWADMQRASQTSVEAMRRTQPPKQERSHGF